MAIRVNLVRKQYQLALAAVFLAIVVAVFIRQRNTDAEQQTTRYDVLCSECGHRASLTGSEVRDQAGAENELRAGPDFGPGLPCPQCSKATMYSRPIKCGQCGADFFASRSPAINQARPIPAIEIRCPKCGWEG